MDNRIGFVFGVVIALLLGLLAYFGYSVRMAQQDVAQLKLRVFGLEQYVEANEIRRAFRDSVLLNHEVEIQLQRIYHPFDGTERESPEFCFRYRQVKLLQARIWEQEKPFLGENYYMETQLY